MSNSLWSSDLLLGVPSMDEAHKALLRTLAHLHTVPDANFPAHYVATVADLETDFREEEELMEEIDFPGIRSHREQHAKLLGGLHHATAAILEGDIALGRHTIALLPQWFVFHISTMDTALSFYLQFGREEPQVVPASEGSI